MSMSTFIMLITIIMMLLASLLSMKSFLDRNKSSPFECGFDPFKSPRLPFSLHFFLIAMIFLIFDIEISLLIPLIFLININSMSYFIIMIFFFIILLMGLYYEWYQGALNWLF
uniref:NADH-ubiquinone oxidoreductase chain 3 n=1 Tax=Pselaphinae sp. 8 EF-2015 TaxID=1756862 RepID=A0A0S2M8Q6_9COLE|nr:NADH deshydrogenase subunit 3 [Pselaphinae sp. 8 EF-2015]